ncbi:hypothetical protein ACOMHN_028745 [Nucella lapillus]
MMASSKPSVNHSHSTSGNERGMKELTNGRAAPPETDLDYISRPENYGGSNLQSLQRFFLARDKQQKTQRQSSKKKKRRREEDELFRRYRHILPHDDSSPLSESEDSGEEGKERERFAGGVMVGSDGSSRKKSPQQQVDTSVAVSETPRSRPSSQRISDARNLPSTDGLSGDDRFANTGTDRFATTTDRLRKFSRQAISDSDPRSKSDNAVISEASSKSDTSLTLSSVTVASPGWPGGVGEGGGGDLSLSSSGRKLWTRAIVKNRFASLSADVKSSQWVVWPRAVSDTSSRRADTSSRSADTSSRGADTYSRATEGLTPPVEGLTPPVEGLTPPVEGLTPPVEGLTPPVEGLTPPVEGLTPPVEPQRG